MISGHKFPHLLVDKLEVFPKKSLTLYQISYGYVSKLLDHDTFNFWEVLNPPNGFSANSFVSMNDTLFIFQGLEDHRFLDVCAKFLV